MNKRIIVALGMAASLALTACSSDAESGSGSSDNQVEASENADGDGGDSSRSGIRGINVDEDSSVKVDDRYEGRFNEYLQENYAIGTFEFNSVPYGSWKFVDDTSNQLVIN